MEESKAYHFTVSPACTQCSACSHVCPAGIIVMTAEGPTLPNARMCIRCGHCVAVCPVEALDLSLTPLANQKRIDPALSISEVQAEQFLRSRRSVRAYRRTEVSTERLEKLAAIAHYAPTGGNSQNVSFVVIKNSETIGRLSSLTMDWMEQQAQVSVSFRQYATLVKASRRAGADVIFRGAPAVMVAVGQRRMPITRDSGHFSLAYAELFAPTLGLGTCWAGFFEMSAAEYQPDIYDILGLSEEQMVVGALMVGYPKYHFKRMVDRDPLKLTLI